ncbi:MAG: bifunctional adenosylcobinamide kinase/adenosylcobinamide-phosphate guanylyltransferase, partial [Clostridium sp.]|nr:bifunctional adenosylcobinamide kinase/adenosylcobinamide-phosphate guanylyltransferase [Clostridium sp.]MDY5483449.1 bifunctional adenosylcobinamide kinase/adenosylcobinamide-phosphate guanylyltransferase [Clostridium sp.]
MFSLITGGSGSGKSEYAENLARETGGTRLIYLATMRVWDEEGR